MCHRMQSLPIASLLYFHAALIDGGRPMCFSSFFFSFALGRLFICAKLYTGIVGNLRGDIITCCELSAWLWKRFSFIARSLKKKKTWKSFYLHLMTITYTSQKKKIDALAVRRGCVSLCIQKKKKRSVTRWSREHHHTYIYLHNIAASKP